MKTYMTFVVTVDDDRLSSVEPVASPLREEWQIRTEILEPAFAHDRSSVGHISWGQPTTEQDARHTKAWREALHGEVDGRLWPKVKITLHHRLTSDWEPEVLSG